MNWIRWTASLLGALLVLVLGVAAYVAATFDAERTKRFAIEWMQQRHQRTLAVDGPVRLSMWPRLALTLEQVRLSEQRRTDEFARVGEAALAVELWPLLRQRIAVERIVLHEAHFRYTRDAQGRRNVDDLLGADERASAPEGTGAPGSALDVAAVELRNVTLSIDDRPAGVRGTVALRALSAGRVGRGRETPLELDALLALQQPQVQGALKGRTRLQFDAGALALRDVALDYRGAFGTLEQGELSLSLRQFGFVPGRAHLQLERLALELKARHGGAPVGARLQWPRLQALDRSLSGSGLSGDVSLGGATPLQLKFTSAAPAGSFERVRLPAFEATISGGGTRRANGRLAAELSLQPADAALALDAIELQLQLQAADAAPLVLAARGRAAGSTEAASWQLAGTLDDHRFQTRGSASFAAALPRIKADAEFAVLDLDRLRARSTGAGPAPTADAPLDLGALNRLDGSVALRAGRLVSGPFRLDDARVDAVLDGGRLNVTTLAGRVWGGSFAGTASADAQRGRVSINGTAQGIDMRAALRDVARKDLLEGNGRFTVDLASAGRSIAELKARAAGSASVQLRDGAIRGVNLARTLREAKAALTLRRDTLLQARQDERTDFSELSASFVVADGVARSRDLDVKSPFLRLGGEGAIDIANGRIDYTVRATVADTAKGQGGAELDALRGLTVPVRLTGPLDAVDWQVQWSAVAQTAVRQRLEDKLRERLGIEPAAPAASQPSDRERLKEALRGLLR